MTDNTKSIFYNGDVVAMIGDSITWDGRWWVSLREQLLSRQTGLQCEFRNCGIPGGGAEGALRRYAWDIAPMKPSLTMVMFGMNDVRRDAYMAKPSEAMISGRAECLQRFLANMNALVERLIQDGIRVVLLTPTPYDQYATEREEANLSGVDDALAICAGMIRGIAIARHLPLVDLHTPLRQRCAELEPLISDDRVHPSEIGHEAMSQLVAATLLPGDPVVVAPSLRAASLTLHEAEKRQRIIAWFRCWADGMEGGIDDDSVRRLIEKNYESEQNPWVREQMILCRELLSRQDELAKEVAALRQKLAELVARTHGIKEVHH